MLKAQGFLATLIVAVSLAIFGDIELASAQSVCDGVLRDGVFQRQEWHNSYESQLVLAARLSRMSYQEAKNRTDAGIGIQIPDLPPLSGHYSQEEFNIWKEQVDQSLDVEQLIKHQSSVLLTSGDANILQAWSGCIARNGGLTVYLEPRGDDEAVVKFHWTPYQGSPTLDPVIQGFSLSQTATITAGEHLVRSGANVGIRAERIVRVSRRSGAAVLAILNTDVTDQEAYLPAKPRPIARPQTPQTAELCRCTGQGSGVWKENPAFFRPMHGEHTTKDA